MINIKKHSWIYDCIKTNTNILDKNKINKKKISKQKINNYYITNKKNYYAGQMTVYLTMTLAVIIPLILTMIEGARLSGMKLQIECMMDMGTNSILAEYQRALLEQYGLLFVDTAYGQDEGTLDYTEEHLSDYLEYNLNPEKDLLLMGSRDFYGLTLEDLEFTSASRASDEEGAVFRYMATSYMLEKYGLAYIQDAADLVQKSEDNHVFEGNILEENDLAQAAIENIVLPEAEEGMDWSDLVIDNPTENVNEARRKGILSLVCFGDISEKSINPYSYISKRNIVAGEGLWDEWEERNSLEETLLFNEYVMQMTGNYISPKSIEYKDVVSETPLSYQTEYIITGKYSDRANLREIANRLLLIRGTANTIYFFTNEELQSEAEAAAAALSCVVAIPELESIFKAAIIAAWIYAESIFDLQLLFAGKRVPLIKQDGDWNINVDSALGMSEFALEGDHRGEKGQTYADYLRLLLYATSQNDVTMRMMDIVEMDVRKTVDNEFFKLDNCVAAFRIQAIFQSSYGYNFLINREFGYY